MIALRGYYSRYLGLVITKEREPVLGLIARVGDKVELEKMLLLVLGCAVTCQARGRHIKKILGLEEEMKTRILLAVSSLELEVAYLNMNLVEKKEKEINYMDRSGTARKESNDSGILCDNDYEIDDQSDNESVTTVTKSDFACQHNGFFETIFDENEKDNDTSRKEVRFIQVEKPVMRDFECQFESPKYMTSAIVDIDDTLDIQNTTDAGTDPCQVNTIDSSTDPVFQDMVTIQSLKKKVVELEQLVQDMLEKNVTISDMKKQIKNWERKCGVANLRHKKARQEIESLTLALMLVKEEADNLRQALYEMNNNDRVDERITDLQSKLGKL